MNKKEAREFQALLDTNKSQADLLGITQQELKEMCRIYDFQNKQLFPKTIAEKILAIQEISRIPELPYAVNRIGLDIILNGDQISFTEKGDFLTLKEARESIKALLALLEDK